MDKGRRAATAGLVGSFLPTLLGLAASAALLVDYVRPQPVFCDAIGGGCDAVRHSVFAAPLGIPLPAIGVAGFFAIGLTALLSTPRARALQLVLSVVAGLAGLVLLGAQLRMGQVCPYCSVVDASGLLCVPVAAWRLRWAADAPVPRTVSYGAAVALVAATVAPLIAGFRSGGVPRVIRDEIARSPKGRVTVVDFVDFECPFCRMTHAEFGPMVEAHKEHVRLVRIQVPLRSHRHALDAAHAACCGERFGKGDAMADALFSAPVEELTPEGCERIAASLGLPLELYRACVTDPATGARIDQDRATFKAAEGYALPTIWIGERQFIGAQPREVLGAALHEALARAGS